MLEANETNSQTLKPTMTIKKTREYTPMYVTINTNSIKKYNKNVQNQLHDKVKKTSKLYKKYHIVMEISYVTQSDTTRIY